MYKLGFEPLILPTELLGHTSQLNHKSSLFSFFLYLFVCLFLSFFLPKTFRMEIFLCPVSIESTPNYMEILAGNFTPLLFGRLVSFKYHLSRNYYSYDVDGNDENCINFYSIDSCI